MDLDEALELSHMEPDQTTAEASSNETNLVAWIAIGLFAISFLLPAVVMDMGGDLQTWPGWYCFANSIYGFFCMQLEMLANWFFVGAIRKLFQRDFAIARRTALVGLLFASETFSLFFLHVPTNEGGVGPGMVLKYPHIGFLLWYASLCVIAVYAHSKLPEESTIA